MAGRWKGWKGFCETCHIEIQNSDEKYFCKFHQGPYYGGWRVDGNGHWHGFCCNCYQTREKEKWFLKHGCSNCIRAKENGFDNVKQEQERS